MAKENLKEQEKLKQEKVEEKVSAIEKFFNENKKLIWSCLGVLVLIGLLILSYQKFYLGPDVPCRSKFQSTRICSCSQR